MPSPSSLPSNLSLSLVWEYLKKWNCIFTSIFVFVFMFICAYARIFVTYVHVRYMYVFTHMLRHVYVYIQMLRRIYVWIQYIQVSLDMTYCDTRMLRHIYVYIQLLRRIYVYIQYTCVDTVYIGIAWHNTLRHSSTQTWHIVTHCDTLWHTSTQTWHTDTLWHTVTHYRCISWCMNVTLPRARSRPSNRWSTQLCQRYATHLHTLSHIHAVERQSCSQQDSKPRT